MSRQTRDQKILITEKVTEETERVLTIIEKTTESYNELPGDMKTAISPVQVLETVKKLVINDQPHLQHYPKLKDRLPK